MDKDWINCEKYWISNYNQLDSFWYRVRIARITGSKISGLINHSRFATPEETAEEICGIRNIESNEYMRKGIKMEPYARKWLSEFTNKEIREIGLTVPKWDIRFGSSVDGMLSDSICEIKIPKAMYKPLIDHLAALKSGEYFDKFYHKHIWVTHYDQMQLGMAVTGMKYCYYLVYLPSSNPEIPLDYYCEQIHFNPSYWNMIYKLASEKYDELILPLMLEYDIKRIDPAV